MNTGGNMEKLSVNALTYDSEVRRGCMDGGLRGRWIVLCGWLSENVLYGEKMRNGSRIA